MPSAQHLANMMGEGMMPDSHERPQMSKKPSEEKSKIRQAWGEWLDLMNDEALDGLFVHCTGGEILNDTEKKWEDYKEDYKEGTTEQQVRSVQAKFSTL